MSSKFKDIYTQLLSEQKKERTLLLEKYSRERKYLVYDKMDCIQELGTTNRFLIIGWDIKDDFVFSGSEPNGYYYGYDIVDNQGADKSSEKKLAFLIARDRFTKIDLQEDLNIGSTYLLKIENTNFYKVGISMDVKGRVAALQIGSPFKINIVAVRETLSPKELEKKIHLEFDRKRVSGEWFELCDEDVAEIINVLFG